MEERTMTIARLAQAANVGVETVRYYERRGLVDRPSRASASYRHYDRSHVARIRFIKRAQELGFTLAEIETLLVLEDGADRQSIRRIAGQRLQQIRSRIADLRRMEQTLAHVLHDCEREDAALHCPIIGAIAAEQTSKTTRRI